MKKIVRIFTSGWIFLLAMAVLIIGGRTKSEAMLWIGTVLLLLGAAVVALALSPLTSTTMGIIESIGSTVVT